jgi:GDPmannose 4,6-dehydratase
MQAAIGAMQKDYVEAMYLMLQQEEPEDFVIATGITTTVRDFIRMSFEELGAELEFKGKGIDEKGFIKSCDDKFSFKTRPGSRGGRFKLFSSYRS